MEQQKSNQTAQIAQEIRLRPNQVEAAVVLLDGGATVPFIARYRKEVVPADEAAKYVLKDKTEAGDDFTPPCRRCSTVCATSCASALG